MLSVTRMLKWTAFGAAELQGIGAVQILAEQPSPAMKTTETTHVRFRANRERREMTTKYAKYAKGAILSLV